MSITPRRVRVRQPVRERPSRRPAPFNNRRPRTSRLLDNTNTQAADNFRKSVDVAIQAAKYLPVGRWLKAFSTALEIALTLKDMYELYDKSRAGEEFILPNGWELVATCAQGAAIPIAQAWVGQALIHCSETLVPAVGTDQPFSPSWKYAGIYKYYKSTNPSLLIRKISHVYGKVPGQNPTQLPRRVLLPPVINPNVLRHSPGPPESYEMVSPPAAKPQPREWTYSTDKGMKGSQHARQPPKARVAEHKVISRAARIGIIAYKALDEISEKAELVDSVFSALPEDVQKYWKARNKDRMGDSFGQYGLDGADWKLRAIYYNHDKIDASLAVSNIIENYIEDKVIGAYQKYMPKNTVMAMDMMHQSGNGEWSQLPPEAVVSKLLKKVYDTTDVSFDWDDWLDYYED